jgi:hypothetical protein
MRHIKQKIGEAIAQNIKFKKDSMVISNKTLTVSYDIEDAINAVYKIFEDMNRAEETKVKT